MLPRCFVVVFVKFLKNFLCICESMQHGWVQKAADPLKLGLRDSCELPSMGAGNRTQGL